MKIQDPLNLKKDPQRAPIISKMGPKWSQIPGISRFALLGPKMQKSAHFPFLEPKVRKSAHFRILTPKSLNSDAETIGFISICGQGAKMTQKCILGPKYTFGAKSDFGVIFSFETLREMEPKSDFGAIFAFETLRKMNHGPHII